MFKHPKRFLVPSVITAAVASAALVACGGSDDSSATAELAKYIPADAPVYIEGTVQPEGDVATNVDSITEKLTGKTLGDTINEALASSDNSDIDFKADVEPWLGESAGLFVHLDLGGISASSVTGDAATAAVTDSEAFGLVAQTTDVDAANAFIEKVSKEDGATDGEYEGFSYKISKDDKSAMGIVDDNLVASSDEAVFKSMVDASKGDSLDGTDAFSSIVDKVDDDSLLNVFVANEAVGSTGAEAGLDTAALYKTLGMDFAGTGTILSLVPEENEISIRGVSDAGSEYESGDPSELIKSFPANTVFATGSGDVGANATKVIEAVNKDGIEGMIKPGELDKMLDQMSQQGMDVRSLIENLETVGMFVSGDSIQSLGGALVATSSDIKPIENSLKAFSSLMALADDADVRPLGGGMTGFRVTTDQLPGRPVVIAVGKDRLVVAIGMPAARQALKQNGTPLSASPAFQAADESIPGEGIDMFGDPTALGDLLSGIAGGDDDAAKAIEILGKFEYMAGGSGEEDNSMEFNLGLKD
ncbi:MAG: DUF3352 domain-containing protein [Actinomycetota bacterium]|nr:DUF3352 domain-containing protein [Actinomycetota bacterium]